MATLSRFLKTTAILTKGPTAILLSLGVSVPFLVHGETQGPSDLPALTRG
jgi:hypothetical protein